MKITSVESFDLRLPASEKEVARGVIVRTSVTRVRTDAGIVGYSFHSPGVTDPSQLASAIAPALVGKDPLAIEMYLKREPGLLNWPTVEHALWDIAGKAAGMPVSRLLGGARDQIPVYLTCVWQGNPDQSDVSIERQVDDIGHYLSHGFRAIKYRVWRPDPLTDVEVARAIRRNFGGREKVELMLDRTAHAPGVLWD